MKIVKKCIAILLYLLLMAWILHFNIAALFDVKQICLVLLGTVILYLPNINAQDKQLDRELIGQNALLGSMLACFVLIFAAFSKPVESDGIFAEMILVCRPLLYGFCIWMICGEGEGERQNERDGEHLSLEDCRDILQEMGLTKREIEVSVLVLQGLMNKEIAQELFISETTVKKHLSNVFAKLGINAREELWDKVREKRSK